MSHAFVLPVSQFVLSSIGTGRVPYY